jgi:DNA-binding NtrC family response regulator
MSMPPDPASDRREPRILVIDDEAPMLQCVARALSTEGFGEALLCADPRQAEALLESEDVGVVLLDLVMPHIPGEKLLGAIVGRRPQTPVIVVTATNEVDTAVRCVKAGAFDYLVKPVDFSRLVTVVAMALRQYELRAENRRLQDLIRKPQLRQPECFAPIVTRSPALHALFRHVEAVAPSSEPVLIVGETGVGKELVAQALHRASGRAGELVAVNVAGIDDTAFADTLFGHEKGAFTGADRDREGMIERTGEGSLFLDEIGDLGLEMQTKLLRLVQEGEFFPLGSDRCRRSRCRIIAATNRDLRVRMREDRFREDLYYRLHGHLIRVPPLRERAGDIPLLVERFLKEASEALGKPVPTPPRELTVHLAAYAFPGNVRELRAMVVDAVTRHERGVLSLESFLDHMDRASDAHARPEPAGENIAFGHELPTLEQATRALIMEALKRAGSNQGAAARQLGISRRTVNRYARDASPSSSAPNP